MKKTYWGVIRDRRALPSFFYDKFTDAKYACARFNRIYETDKKKPYYIKRYVLEVKGEQVDLYEHTTKRVTKKS